MKVKYRVLYNIVNRIKNVWNNKMAVKTRTAFEHNSINSTDYMISIDRIPLNMANNILRIANDSQIVEIVGNCNQVEDGTGTLIFPKWFMKGLVMGWEKREYVIKDGRFNIKPDLKKDGECNISDAKHGRLDSKQNIADTSQTPSVVVNETVVAPSLSGNIPSSTQYENLSDKTLIERIIASCEGCETKGRCFWNRMKDVNAIRECPCAVCIIKSMCKQYCDLLINATKK
jgi:hypothetical protein